MPPGSAKSTYASVLFPAWYLANNHGHALIGASHTSDLAEDFSLRVRNLISSHTLTLGVSLSPHSRAVSRWSTNTDSVYVAAGVGTAIAGRRADLAIIDDPIRSREAADSEDLREKHWQWWINDVMPRLKPGAPVVLIQTRWHEDDLGGRMLAREEGWNVLRLPMLAEEDDPLGRSVGDPLWPEWFTPRMVASAQRDTRKWSALYQQRPVPDTGDYFRREWLRPIDVMPDARTLRIYGASDYAVTKGGGDYTVHVVVGIDADERLYVLDLWRGQADSAAWVDAFCALVLKWRPIQWAEEGGQINAGVGPFLERRMREKRAFVAREQFPSRHDKATRAQSIRGRMSLAGLCIPALAPWRVDLEAELLSFPAGVHDDQVDALGLIGQMLDTMTSPAPARPEEEALDMYARAFRRQRSDASEWKVL